MKDYRQIVHDGLFGLLVGDALGVPYEFHQKHEIPPFDQIEFEPPQGFHRTYAGLLPGTWSDDGAQALCLLDSLIRCGKLDVYDFGNRLVKWLYEGLWAVDNEVFDCGIQTSSALRELARGIPPDHSGFCNPNGKGNGALMRVLPLALWHRGTDEELVKDAHSQAIVTHGHICNQVCCALYCMWARRIITGESVIESYNNAVESLRSHYRTEPEYTYELEGCIAEGVPTGSGFVVDSLRSTKYLLFIHDNYERVVKGAVSFGNDTDTTAAIAGGLAGIAFGGIPERWLSALRDKVYVDALIQSLFSQE